MDLFFFFYSRKSDEPFGGVQMILIGDLYQLPPVVMSQEREIFKDLYKSPFFFDAKVFAGLNLEFLELETIWRQKEDRFIRMLNAVRSNNLTDADLRALSSRYQPDFEPKNGEFYVYLTTTNDLADEINRSRLRALKGKVYGLSGEMSGKFEERVLPTQQELELKFGAQVMLLNNDSLGRWVNGSIGVVTDIIHGQEGDAVRVRLAEGSEVDVVPFTWEMYRFVYDEESRRISSEIVGTFTQYPLRLAWAVTIHKAQGKTFSKVVIDVGWGTFSHGQMYVALSRCTTLEGVVLKKPFLRRHIMLDGRIKVFLENFKKSMQERHIVLE